MTQSRSFKINGERLRAARLADPRFKSQYDLADASGVSRSYISEIEKGLKQPSRRVATVLADTLNVGLEALMS